MKPQEIHFVTPPGMQGAIGMMACPGRRASAIESEDWVSAFLSDLEAVRACKPALVLALLGEQEFLRPPFPQFVEQVGAFELPWEFLPVGNYGIPDERFMHAWEQLSTRAVTLLRSGRRIILHCRYGLGRTGLVACMMLMECGMDAESAIQTVRVARPNTIQNDTQMRFVSAFRPFTTS